MKRVGGIRADPFERRRCVDVPEESEGTVTPQTRNALFEQLVEDADTTRLNQEIGVARLFESPADAVFRRRIDNDPRPVRVRDVAVLLSVEGVGLVKGDAMPVGSER